MKSVYNPLAVNIHRSLKQWFKKNRRTRLSALVGLLWPYVLNVSQNNMMNVLELRKKYILIYYNIGFLRIDSKE